MRDCVFPNNCELESEIPDINTPFRPLLLVSTTATPYVRFIELRFVIDIPTANLIPA
jgi:hypothetical protein